MRAILVVAFSILISGCIQISAGPDPKVIATIDKIGIVTLVGDAFALDYVGPTIFQNKTTFVAIPGLNMDSELDVRIRESLKTHSKFEIVDMTYDKNSLMKIYGPYDSKNSNNYNYFLYEPDLGLIKNALLDLATKNNIRYIIVVSRGGYLGYQNANFQGYGLLNYQDQGKNFFVHVHFGIVDTRTGKEISYAMTLAQDTKTLLRFPTDANYSKEELSQIRSAILEKLDTQLDPIVSVITGDYKHH